MKKGVMHKYVLKCCMIAIFIMTIFSLHNVANVWAKYKSTKNLLEQAKVADFGTLTFLEYKSDGSTLISGTEANVEIINVSPGTNINKRLTVSFSDNEVDVYVFFVIQAESWELNEFNTNRLAVKNHVGDDLMYWELNNNWTYLKTNNLNSETNEYIFYATAVAFKGLLNDVMNEIHVNSFGFEDANVFESSEFSLSFDTFAISKPGATPEEAWSKING